jgi:sulfhydrogenase subunit beta (sulfur reductase)
MADTHSASGVPFSLPKSRMDEVLRRLQEKGYQTIGPRVRDGSVVYKPIASLADLPLGYSSEESNGQYRLRHTGHTNYFEARPGAQSWKQFFFPSRTSLLALHKNAEWKIQPPAIGLGRLALIGVRPCELAAIRVQDLAFLRDDFTDPVYQQRRKNSFIVAMQCLHPGGTCFCASMGTGPRLESGFDLGLTELDDVFLIQSGSESGAALLKELNLTPAKPAELKTAEKKIASACETMGRQLDIRDLPDALLQNLDHPEWEAVAKRCLSCASCTLACPTCFCWDIQDHTDLGGCDTNRTRVWDSCFNPGYSYQTGGNARPNVRARYRQWLSHKLGTWKEQYGVFGCVGCGRCITWCPVKIDITEEIAALRKETIS